MGLLGTVLVCIWGVGALTVLIWMLGPLRDEHRWWPFRFDLAIHPVMLALCAAWPVTVVVARRRRTKLPLSVWSLAKQVAATISRTDLQSTNVDARLAQQHPRLVNWLASAAPDLRADCVRHLVTHAAQANGVADECQASLDLEALVAHLDEQAWSIREAADTGHATEGEYDTAFRRARAAGSWMIASRDTSLSGSASATYEALHALCLSEDAVLDLLRACADHP